MVVVVYSSATFVQKTGSLVEPMTVRLCVSTPLVVVVLALKRERPAGEVFQITGGFLDGYAEKFPVGFAGMGQLFVEALFAPGRVLGSVHLGVRFHDERLGHTGGRGEIRGSVVDAAGGHADLDHARHRR